MWSSAAHFLCVVLAGLQPLAAAVTIAEINGNRFLSPYLGQTVTDVTGLVTAKGPNGIWVRSTTPDDDPATSESIYVYSKTVGADLAVGDIISFGGKVAEYRSDPSYMYLAEIISPANVTVLSSGNTVAPLVIGVDTIAPPTVQYSSLDGGDIYAYPNGVANISSADPVLEPSQYGLDFWESLSGELVTVKKPVAVVRPNNYRDTWVIGDWGTTGRNSNGGLTMTDKDSNPEAVVVGTPLDGTKNPLTSKMGDQFEDITGVVQFVFGFYYILPLTAVTVSTPSTSAATPSSLKSKRHCKAITVGVYNVENLNPKSSHLPGISSHIVDYLKMPDIVFLQEVQDNSGATDDGEVSANVTLSTLSAAILGLTNVSYAFAEVVASADNADGGAPGGNIRQAFLYRSEVVSLYKPKQGGAGDAAQVVRGLLGPSLSYNPGRIEPANEAWADSRKPLVAAWRAKGAIKPFYTVNVHWSSKGGGTSLHGDVRPPINGAIDKRLQQANVTATFIRQILKQDKLAYVIAAGDFNEFAFVQPMKNFVATSGLKDLDEVTNVPATSRYTYTYDMNSQSLDHMYVSPALATKSTKFQHIHLNSWAARSDMVSDHDPSVALVDVCGY